MDERDVKAMEEYSYKGMNKTIDMKAKYEQTKEQLPYPRVEYKCECGFRLVQMEGYNTDYRSDDFGKLIIPKGKCMKCNNEIELKQ